MGINYTEKKAGAKISQKAIEVIQTNHYLQSSTIFLIFRAYLEFDSGKVEKRKGTNLQ